MNQPDWIDREGSTPHWLGALWADRQKLTDKPTLVLWGMKDIAFREKELNRWIELFPTATVKRFETAGHFVQEEGGDELYRGVEDFLGKGSKCCHPDGQGTRVTLAHEGFDRLPDEEAQRSGYDQG